MKNWAKEQVRVNRKKETHCLLVISSKYVEKFQEFHVYLIPIIHLLSTELNRSYEKSVTGTFCHSVYANSILESDSDEPGTGQFFLLCLHKTFWNHRNINCMTFIGTAVFSGRRVTTFSQRFF